MPELIDDLTPEPEPEPASTAGPVRPPGFAAAAGEADGTGGDGTRRASIRTPPAKRRLDKQSRNSVIALVLAVAAFIASNSTDLAAVVAGLWILSAVAFVIAVVDGVRGRRHVQIHPDRYHGLWFSTISVVLACGGLVALTVSVLAVVADKPASEAPAGVGDLHSVQTARWGYQRATRLSDNGWKQPARAVGSCWVLDSRAGRERDEQRVELAEISNDKTCTSRHTLQSMKVFAVNRDADAPYPGSAKLLALGAQECKEVSDRLTKKGVDFVMKVEYPTEVGWGDGDHDVACVAVTPVRTSPLST